MSRDQRLADNWALLKATELARAADTVVCIVFASKLATLFTVERRCCDFMVDGLRQVALQAVAEYHIPFRVLDLHDGEGGDIGSSFLRLVNEVQASHVVTDFSPMRHHTRWLDEVRTALDGAAVDVGITQVDAHNVVPAWVPTKQREYGARTIRPKLCRALARFLTDIPALQPQSARRVKEVCGNDALASPQGVDTWDRQLAKMACQAAPPVTWCSAGEANARVMLDLFLHRIRTYDETRNDASRFDHASNLSPYFHFGQLAPQRAIVEAIRWNGGSRNSGKSAFIEEALVRRELAENFVLYTERYDDLRGAWDWAQVTLAEHANDEREYVYTEAQFEAAETHDELWNAAQRELVVLGKMAGYLRMFWAKQILAWSSSPEEAFRIALYLNDKYSLDGRDPNGVVGVAWSVAGVHDQGWAERAVYGKVRCMKQSGCARKFSVPAYLARVKVATSGKAKRRANGSQPTLEMLVQKPGKQAKRS